MAKGFDCPRKGHVPMMDDNNEVFIIEGRQFIGKICRKCKCPYFIQVNDEKVKPSQILTLAGKSAIIKGD